MITKQELEGHWNDLKDRVRERWGQFTDEELVQFRGNADQLVGLIQERTGESRRAVETYLEEAVSNASSVVARSREAARDFATNASRSMRDQYDHITDSVRDGYENAGQWGRAHPVHVLALVFGAGILAGAALFGMKRR